MRIGKLKLLEKRIIDNDPLLGPLVVRWIIFRHPKFFGVFLHKLCRSDHDRATHTHPWAFISLILKNGYKEIVQLKGVDTDCFVTMNSRPGDVLYRPADWSHRVIIEEGKPAWTLVVMGKRKQKWGFWVPQPKGFKWCWWAKYDTHKAICEEDQIWPTDGDDI